MTDAIERGRPVKRHASGSPRPVVQPWEPAEAVLKRIRKIVESSLSGPVGPYQALEEIDDVLKGNYILDSRNREEAR